MGTRPDWTYQSQTNNPAEFLFVGTALHVDKGTAEQLAAKSAKEAISTFVRNAAGNAYRELYGTAYTGPAWSSPLPYASEQTAVYSEKFGANHQAWVEFALSSNNYSANISKLVEWFVSETARIEKEKADAAEKARRKSSTRKTETGSAINPRPVNPSQPTPDNKIKNIAGDHNPVGVGGTAQFWLVPLKTGSGSIPSRMEDYKAVRFHLLPARRSFYDKSAQQVPDVEAGMNFTINRNLAELPIPGSTPVIQEMGIKSHLITMVGAFVGFDIDDLDQNQLLGIPATHADMKAKTMSNRLSAQPQALELLRAISLGREIAVVLTTKASGQTFDIRHYSGQYYTGRVKLCRTIWATEQRIYWKLVISVTNRDTGDDLIMDGDPGIAGYSATKLEEVEINSGGVNPEDQLEADLKSNQNAVSQAALEYDRAMDKLAIVRQGGSLDELQAANLAVTTARDKVQQLEIEANALQRKKDAQAREASEDGSRSVIKK